MGTKNKPNEIYLTRIYNAAVKTVWNAWADSEQVAQWWGPRGFSLTTHSKELRTGGTWDYTMHGPDGKDYPNLTKYIEVVEYVRMVYDHGSSKNSPALFRVTVEFIDLKDKTQLEITMSLATEQAAQTTKKFIKQAGGDATWDRLAEHLEKQSSNKEIFVLNRSFAADIDTLFEMWTSPKHIAQWLAPTGLTMQFITADIREGGTNFYKMSDAEEKMVMYGKIQYREISKPRRLVYTQVFSDQDGNVSRHPMAPTWPETMLTTITFTPEGAKQTRLTIEWEVFGQARQEEINAFVQEKPGMTRGWTGSLDQLENYITTLK